MKRVLWMTGALALVSCGGSPPPPSTRELQENTQRVLTAYNGPKLRVAVGQFGDLEATKTLLEEMNWKGIAPLIAEQVVTGLTQTGRVAVVERSQLDKVIGNLQLEKESDKSRYFDQSTTAEIGKFQGAQVVFVGAITEFEPNVSGNDSGFSVASLVGMKYHEDKAVVGVDVRLVDQQTGRVMYAAHARGEVLTQKFEAGVSYKEAKIGTSAWARTPLGQATREAADGAIQQLIAAIQLIPFEAPVLDVRDGKRLFIGAGHDAQLKEGDRFEIIHRGDAITDPSGAVVGYDERKGGWCQIQTVQDKMSVATVIEGEMPKTGDVVRLPLEQRE